MLSLNVIGAGRVGQVLAHLFARHQQFSIAQVFNLSDKHNQLALELIGVGRGITNLAQASPADVTLLSVPDDNFVAVTEALLAAGALRHGSTLFHCSGSKSSQDLLRLVPELQNVDLHLASIHPIRSFANPSAVVQDFPGTICSVEGDAQALTILRPAFETIGAKLVAVDPAQKLLYHAASVFASNYLVTLLDTSLAAYCAAGIERSTAQQMMASLASKTLENVLALGPHQALTGPIKRGDMHTVQIQNAVVNQWDPDRGNLYQAFIAPTIALAKPYSEK